MTSEPPLRDRQRRISASDSYSVVSVCSLALVAGPCPLPLFFLHTSPLSSSAFIPASSSAAPPTPSRPHLPSPAGAMTSKDGLKGDRGTSRVGDVGIAQPLLGAGAPSPPAVGGPAWLRRQRTRHTGCAHPTPL